jgi:hypothetical protein
MTRYVKYNVLQNNSSTSYQPLLLVWSCPHVRNLVCTVGIFSKERGAVFDLECNHSQAFRNKVIINVLAFQSVSFIIDLTFIEFKILPRKIRKFSD